MKPLIVANWKMNTTLAEAMVLGSGIKEGLVATAHIDVVLCPPFPYLVPIAEVVHHHRLPHLFLGGQNIFWKEEGAYTGEVGAKMLKGLASYVIVGHSERRRCFHETDQEIASKVRLALAHRLKPILCVGEERRPTDHELLDPSEIAGASVRQPLEELEAVLKILSKEEQKGLIIAYEPVWAISARAGAKPATGLYADAVAGLLRRQLVHTLGERAAEIPILYGGSVAAENAAEFTHQANLNGLLVGNASLHSRSFLAICRAVV